jgi:hypothetical protein
LTTQFRAGGLFGVGMGVMTGFALAEGRNPNTDWLALMPVLLFGLGFMIFGAPIPAAFFHWEGPPGKEQWVDFITPAPLLFAGSNVVILALLAAIPVGLAFRFRRRVLATPGSATDVL